MKCLSNTPVSSMTGSAKTATRTLAKLCLSLIWVVVLIGLELGSVRGQDAAPGAGSMLSSQFTQSATSALVGIHQAKQNIATVLTKNLPNAYYNPDLAARAYEQVRTAQVGATTDGDKDAALLLNSYFMKVKNWADKYKEARRSMNATRTMGEDFLREDTDWQAIETCEKALNNVLIHRAYNDVPSCR